MGHFSVQMIIVLVEELLIPIPKEFIYEMGPLGVDIDLIQVSEWFLVLISIEYHLLSKIIYEN